MRIAYFLIVFLLIMLPGADNGAQVPCISCPQKDTIITTNISEYSKPFKDSLEAHTYNLKQKQDSLLTLLKREYKKHNRPSLRRSESVQLLTGRWRYNWYYDRLTGNYLFVKIERL